MAKMRFADGEQEVDDIYVGPLNEVTDGAPESVPFRDAMKRLSRFLERRILRDAQSKVIREHFANFPR